MLPHGVYANNERPWRCDVGAMVDDKEVGRGARASEGELLLVGGLERAASAKLEGDEEGVLSAHEKKKTRRTIAMMSFSNCHSHTKASLHCCSYRPSS
jgi:hypothetical protein